MKTKLSYIIARRVAVPIIDINSLFFSKLLKYLFDLFLYLFVLFLLIKLDFDYHKSTFMVFAVKFHDVFID